ncbi:MAG: antiholin-like murein hydrolase modulator LrgA [Lactobacillus sp.]|nr:antiholin-like murein hydrolase modulator LrgA [Lactobacillus sp.]
MEKKVYSFLQQAFIFALILLISNGIAKILPIPVPAAVIGLLLLFAALCLGIVKLEQVEGLSHSLNNVISFLFVPSGISLVNSLGLLRQAGLQIIFVIMVATLGILLLTGWSASFLLHVKDTHSAKIFTLKKHAAPLKEVHQQ